MIILCNTFTNVIAEWTACNYFQSMEPIPADELKAEKFPRISAEDLIELCELSGPSKAPTPAKSSKSAKPLIVVIDVRSDDEYPSCTDSGSEMFHGNVFVIASL